MKKVIGPCEFEFTLFIMSECSVSVYGSPNVSRDVDNLDAITVADDKNSIVNSNFTNDPDPTLKIKRAEKLMTKR